MVDQNNNAAPSLDLKSEKDRLPQINDVIKGRNGKTYKLIQVLGEGGYGTVFKATEESTNRCVPILRNHS